MRTHAARAQPAPRPSRPSDLSRPLSPSAPSRPSRLSPPSRPSAPSRFAAAIRASARACAVACVAATLIACAHAPARGPAAGVRAEVDQAEAAEQRRQHDVARQHYQRAIAQARDPDSIAFARHEYAETLVTWGEAPEARAQLEIAATASPGDPGVWHDLGMLRHNAGDDAGAIEALTRAEQLAPRDVRPRKALAALYWKRGDKANAAREYRALLELDIPERLRLKVEWALAELAKP
jgi:Flp pilus assembly protein TadD